MMAVIWLISDAKVCLQLFGVCTELPSVMDRVVSARAIYGRLV